MLWLPNLITGLRAVLTPVIVYLILTRQCSLAMPVTVFAGLTDTADGYLARRLGAEGRLGAWLDPIADKMLLTALYITFGVGGLAPVWVVWLVVGRDLMILSLAGLGLFVAAIRDFPPTVWGKLSTLFQIAAAIVFISDCAGWAVSSEVAPYAIWTVGIATGWSGVHYLWTAARRFRQWRAADSTR